MERGKPPAKRGPKTKAALPPPGDFIALGAKSSRPTPTESVEPKLVVPAKSIPTSSERKREAPSGSSSLSLAAKKPKLSSTSSFARPSSSKKEKDSKKADAWDTVAIEVDPSTFLNQVHEAEENGNEERMVALVCGAIKNLRSNRAKPEQALYLSLMFLAKSRPALFCHDFCVEAACTLLKRDATLNFKTKGNAIVSVLCANLLMAAFQDEKQQWPDLFLTVYLEDALGERIWVDHEDCKGFVDNIQTAFNTKIPPKSMMQPEFGFKLEVSASPPTIQMDEDDTSESATSTESKEKQDVIVVPRYTHIQEQAENYILEIIREQIQRRQPMDNFSRNVLRVLTTASGFSEVRLIAVTRMELWLQNAKLMRPAQELLLAVCLNCNQHNQQDVEVISHLIKIRLKTKPLINHYLICIRELLNQHNDNLGTLLKHTIYNELSNSRNPNNMALLGVMFQFAPEQSAKMLAEVFQDLLTNKDDYLRALRALFREIVRSLRHDISYSSFCLGLMQDRKEVQFKELDAQIKERLFHSIADLITLCIFMSITPNVRESASAVARGDRKDLNNLRNYQQMIATIQRDAVWWLQTIVPNMFKPVKNDFMHCLHKVLFMEQSDQYYNKDNWPPENDRMMMLRLASEIPVLEDTLMRLMIMGLSKDHPISAPDAHELVDQLIKRAASLYSEEFQVIQVDRIDIIDVLFNICAYRYPENISLPPGYKPPNLAISNLYWKAWILLLIVTAHNPATFGYEAWGKYPTLRNFIEMCITNHFTFPPPTMAIGEKADELKSQELQIAHLEKQQIVEFENHLASASTKVAITESNSLLADQLTSLDPGGVARRPPQQILDQLTKLNENLKLGHLLCRSRNPDFLLEIIERQGTSQSMPWLADLVESSEGAFSVLPVQCLCEFLLNEPSDSSLNQSASSDKEDGKESSSKENMKADKAEKVKKQEKERKQKQLLRHLQSLLYESDEDSRPTAEVVDYFLRRLSSQQSLARMQAMRGLTLVVTPTKSEDDMEIEIDSSNHREQKWLTQYLPQLPHFESIRAATSVSLRQACQIETDPWVISAYVQYLANFAPDELLNDLADLALNMAQLIVERTTILNYILPSGIHNADRRNLNLQALMIIFLKYVRKAREQEEQQWSESQDKIIIQWITGEAATMHILVVHAMVILLTYGPTTEESLFSEMLEIWFPANSDPPIAYLADTSEEALLLPDWLKLRMIRSNVEILVDAALRDLDPSQLVLFIQSFGIPVATVSKLLQALDTTVQYAGYEMESVVADKSYMLQLVEVQRQRGAVGGLKFVEFLEDEVSTSPKIDDEPEIFIPKKTPVITPAAPASSIQLYSLPQKLTSLFKSESTVCPTPEQSSFFRSLHKALLGEAVLVKKPVTVKTIDVLHSLIFGSDSAKVIKGLSQFSSFSCSMFRVLQLSLKNGKDKSKKQLESISITLLEHKLHTSLSVVLQQVVPKSTKQEINKIGKVEKEELNEEYFINSIKKIIKENPLQLEKSLNQILVHGMKSNSSDEMISALIKLLLDTNTENESITPLFIGWLELLEPEIIGRIPDLQQELLFAKTFNSKDVNKSFRPYLLALLTHQSNWETLQRCFERILRSEHVEKYDPTAVLDFVSAYIYIPKLWQGRDKHVPKHYDGENLLGLSENQVLRIIDYILREALHLTCDEKRKLFEKRQHLLLHCCNNRENILPTIVKYLSKFDEKSDFFSATNCLLQQIYLQIPKIAFMIDDVNKFLRSSDGTLSCSSNMDVISQALLTALASTEAGKEWNEKIQDIELACRKMATCHPILTLRQLTMLSALLRGRTQLEFYVFKSRNHFQFFNCVLGILELLQPYLFMKEYDYALKDTFESYFDLIKNHGIHNKELRELINRFLTLLHNFVTNDNQRSVRYIQKHSSLLHDLANAQCDMPSLRLLLAGISLPTQNDDIEEDVKPTVLAFTPTQTAPTRTQAQYVPVLNRLTKASTTEEILSSLQEIDSLSNRNNDVLEHFVDDLKKLLTDQNESCRNLTHNLILRYMKYKPSSSQEFLNSFLGCLDSDQQEVVTSALERLAEFVILSQENACTLLEKAYVVGISTSINTIPFITETMMLLNLQSGS